MKKLAVTSCIKYNRLSILEPFGRLSFIYIDLKLIQLVDLSISFLLDKLVLDNG